MIFSIEILKEKYSDYSNPLDKIKRESDAGRLIRLTRSIYETNINVDPYLVASSILSPSYLSFEFALSYYSLIPERVYSITSASFNQKKNKTFKNKIGTFEFSDITKEAFFEGLHYLEKDGYTVLIATKEKALCDCLSKWRVVHSIKELKHLLFDDKRIDFNDFCSLDFKELVRLALFYKKTNLELLIKMIRKEFDYGHNS